MATLDETLPPIIVHRESWHVIDGVHRVRAAQLRGDSTILARLFDGGEADAFVLAVTSNTRHGLPLSSADWRPPKWPPLTYHNQPIFRAMEIAPNLLSAPSLVMAADR
ncbi:ParB/RepB/Spo0J family partition protein [Nocardia alni]|uniref:ParB/RepB/Spo0J family partition protein n=1 Tax=Nocardia alni TaxID=2815723 RepID=UPI0034D3F6A6